jgi:hypothetical protein
MFQPYVFSRAASYQKSLDTPPQSFWQNEKQHQKREKQQQQREKQQKCNKNKNRNAETKSAMEGQEKRKEHE